MPARIRLQRYGKKGKPFYHIVIADGRAPRDGKFIEQIGTYNPLTIPATINLDIDKSIKWLKNGATPSDTAKAILSYKGVFYKYHLEKGVMKGALTPEQAEAKFNAWLSEKADKIASKIKARELAKKDAKKKALSRETEVNEAREKEQMAKLAKLADKEASEKAAEEPVAETPAVQTPAAEDEAPKAPEASAEAAE
ncbi:MAG: 30S ribosomal protein S16 [Bacteroidetes bacterium ADurb.Bin408]|nr:MAG: 30S ribosomal protein S16 [Bacteroidetes bacterium ADurb.Bin408]